MASQINDSMPDTYRETLFNASIRNRLTREKQVTTTVTEDFTLDEVKELMIDKSPVSVYCLPYSERTPCIHITKLIMPSDGGVYLYMNGWANKTPKHYTWEEFYRLLKSMGLHTIRF